MSDLNTVFSADGLLARNIPDYRPRTQQLEMAQAIAQAIESQEVLVTEAGTGTGKTYAYLVPALLSGGKVILSTGTKTLQDQLFQRDIPTVRAALKIPVTIALLKGRANYICHYHLERTLNSDHIHFASRTEVKYLNLIERYAGTSSHGDKSGLDKVPEQAAIWQHVTSTRENCLGSDCPHYRQCFVMEARKRALSADIVVVNHHLFFADVMLRDEGLSELLPACNTVIFDEAHQLPEVASLFFGESVSTGQIQVLVRDTDTEALLEAKDFAPLFDATAAVGKAVLDLHLTITEKHTRMSSASAARYPGFSEARQVLQEKLVLLAGLLETQAVRSQGLQNCWLRAQTLLNRIRQWHEQSESREFICWVETYSQSLQFNTTPLSVAETFSKQLDASARAWIFTSATLSVKKDFSHYNRMMGLFEAKTANWDSPFDFPNQALLYVPSQLPDPNTPHYTESIVQAVLPVIKASQGRAFILCTSLRNMQQIHELLQVAFQREQLEFPLLLQGQEARSALLNQFRQLGNAVLVGSQSFWEGIDVKGNALSLVIIDRLPFASPDDPVLSARIEKFTREGRNAFMEYQLPHAIISLKQGAGRLIRDEKDRGVLMICDPRLVSKPYGKQIWQSLPPMKRTRDPDEVLRFLENVDQ
ncbi:ATP-dependent DNA helicase [Nitrosomonas europaea]|uniref:DNA 5'-3' helicase n=4 Tax=Nitrosomonas TaxID=914 RepID=Q82W19_NITEU|nr:ATP-dependent DNA helicase [Nitrosomonas europaea]CAD84791.1 probable ATP-dependent DNA helicase-related protein [Nitrosomonas europaea ATCC 19718]SDW17045.1 ATP-dependent DNA helicase DinG [Nitrosomonas europaea]SES78537.1 ATP-dependent DNA helicase DinG [Nitrosomonas europaea]SJZ34113.1 ATP-dependent DNA helicase DinG [Nitrosomonas europaea]